MSLDEERGLRRTVRRIARHVRWAREQGVGRLIEEDQLDPLQRIPLAVSKARWRRRNRIAPNAIPVYLVGVQRSGTNMVVRGLERAPEFEVRNENDRAAFVRFRLRDDAEIRRIVERSGHRYVLFKPLCDSHRTLELLDGLGTPSPGRAIWVYRGVEGRVRSAVAKFGSANLQALRAIAEGRGDGLWQAGGLSEDDRALIRGFDFDRMSPESAAALFWYVRNSLYFELGLDRRSDVTLASYEAFVADPERSTRALCDFLGFGYRPELHAHVDARSAGAPTVDIDPLIRERCRELQARLDAALAERLGAGPG